MMNSVWSWFWGSSSETISLRLKGKLDSLEISNAVIGTEISKGAFGQIVEVTTGNEKYAGQQLDKKLVAEKSQKTLIDNFPCECTRISCLDHANVVKLRGVVINVNTFLPILVTEQLGSPLSEYLLKEHAKPTTQMSILRDVAHGLQYLHCLPNTVLHLCLTPENIVINPDTCQAKICNPGVVNLLQLNPSWCRSNLPRADCFLPELEDTKLDPSIDIFSYGALMIHVFQPQQEPICPPVFLQDPQDSNKIIMGAFVTFDKVMTTGASAAILCKVLETHPMYSLVQKCLMKLPSARPTIINVVNELENKVFIFCSYRSCIHSSTIFLQNDTVNKMDLWEEDIQKKTQTWIEESNCLTITVTGRTGTGKTSLMNGLLGKEVGKEGSTLSRGTTYVESFQAEIQGVRVTIWDTPGLQDGECKDEEYLKEMIDSGCVDANLKVYCLSMANTRFDESEMKALNEFTTKVGVKFWDRCMFVLTFVNGYVSLCPLKIDQKEWLDGRIDQWRNRIKSELLKVGVEQGVVEQISIVPAGYHKPLQITPNPWKLPGIENWFYSFWYTCADVMDPTALPALVKANRHRFKDKITESDLEGTIENVPLPQYLQQGAIVAGAGVAGFGSAAGVGAIVGAV